MRVSTFTTFVSEVSHCKKNSARYFYKCKNVFIYSSRYSGQNLDFPYKLLIIFMKIGPMGPQPFHADERKERPDRTCSNVSQYCKTHLKMNTVRYVKQLTTIYRNKN
jgi:hypothetical protein